MKNLLLIVLFFFSCTKEPLLPIEGIKETVLKKEPTFSRDLNGIIYYAGQHITNHGYITYPMNSWSKTITFTNSCQYITDDPLNQIDWNKLFGIRKNPLVQYRNGAYLVWCYPNKPIGDVNHNRIRLGWYLHDDDGNVISMPLVQSIYVNLNTPVYVSIQNFNDRFVFIIAGQYIVIDKSDNNIDHFTDGDRLSPHFGGQETPDNNVIINFNN